MSQLHKLAKHSSQYFLGSVSVLLLGFISFPIFTRILSVEQYGLLGLVTSVLYVGRAIGNMGLSQAVQRFYGESTQSGEASGIRRYFSTLFFGSLVIGAGTALVYSGLVWIIPSRYLGWELKSVLALASVLILVRVLQAIASNLFQIEGKSLIVSGIEFALKALTIVAVLAALRRWGPTAHTYVAAMIGVEVAVLAATIPYLLRRQILSPSSFNRNFLSTALAFGSPLMWAELGALVHDSSDRVLVQYFLGPTALGLYSAAYGVAVIIRTLLETPVNLALFPLCMDSWNKHGEEETRRFVSHSLQAYCAITVGMLCALTLLSRDLLIILASRKYEVASNLLPVLFAGLVVASLQVFFRVGLLVHKRPSMIVRSTFWAIVANTVANVVLLPWIGVMGAAIATLLSFALQVFLTARESLRVFHFAIDGWAIAKYVSVAAVLIVLGMQIHVASVWKELLVRGALSAFYFGLLGIFDSRSRQVASKAFTAVVGRGA